MFLRALLLFAFLFAPTALVAQGTPAAKSGQLLGTLLIQWSDESRFIYVVDPANPLRYRTKDGREIRPGRMYTDGGSIPRVFWGVKGFSPWGYAPAYIIHDWLFHQHRCGKDTAPNNFTFDEANTALDDVIEILFKLKKVDANEDARRLIKWAVDHFAQGAWKEVCDKEPPLLLALDGFQSLHREFEKFGRGTGPQTPPRAIVVERISFGN